MAIVIEKIFAHIVQNKLGFTYSIGAVEESQSLIWELVAGSHHAFGEAGWAAQIQHAQGERGADGMASTLSAKSCSTQSISRDDHRLMAGFAEPLLGKKPDHLEALLPPMPDHGFHGAWVMCREGLSIALYDLVGRRYGVPVHTLLGGKRRDRAPGMPVIHVGPPEVMARRAHQWVKAGYRYIKVKFRGELEQDLEALKEIRRKIGYEVVMQVDANDGYTSIPAAEKAIRAMMPLGIDLFEDMLNAPLEEIARLRQLTGARIMVDKQSYWPNIREVCRCGAADVVNHHPNLRGGLAVAMAVDAVASAWGVPTAIGSSGECGIQDAAFQHLAALIGLSRPCEDIGLQPYYSGPTKGEYAFEHDPNMIRESFPIIDGFICIPDRPGLGVDIDRKRLESATVKTVVFE